MKKNPTHRSKPGSPRPWTQGIVGRFRSLAGTALTLGLLVVLRPIAGTAQNAPAPLILLESSLTNIAAATQPPVGPAGTTTLAADAFVEADGFTGARCTLPDDRITYPLTGLGPKFPAAGEIEFWFRPGYGVEDDDVNHVLFSIGDIYGAPRIELRENGGLNLTVVIPGATEWTNRTVSSDYHRSLWRAGQWVHVRAGWDPANAEDSLRLHVDSRRVHGPKVPGGWSVSAWCEDAQLNFGSGLAAVGPGVFAGQFPAGGMLRDGVVRDGLSQFVELPYEPDPGGGGGGGGGDNGGEIDPVNPAPIPDPVPITTAVPIGLGWRVPSMTPPGSSPLSRNLDLPLTVKEIAGTGVSSFPVSVVVPLPYGHYQDAGGLSRNHAIGVRFRGGFCRRMLRAARASSDCIAVGIG